MPASVAAQQPKTLAGAQRQFADAFGSLAVQNTYLKLALGLALLAVVGLIGLQFRTQARLDQIKPIIVRMDELGRHETVDYPVATGAAPRENELRRDLTTFVTKHFSRLRGALRRDYPESLYFLQPKLADVLTASERKEIDAFMGSLGGEELDVEVKNVTLTELTTTPYKAQVYFEQKPLQPMSRQAGQKADQFIAHLSFELRDSVPASFIHVNPLGLQITYLRLEQAFQ